MQQTDGDLVKILQAFVDKIPFAESFEMKVQEARKGFVRLAVDPKQALFNHFGTYQAGVYFTAAEIAGGLLCGTFLDLEKHLLITQKSSINFLKATSETLVVTAELSEEVIDCKIIPAITTQRKTTLPVDVFVKMQGGQMVAQCRNDYYLRVGIPKIFIKTHRA